MTDTTVKKLSPFERAAQRFNVQADSIKRRWAPYIDQIPGAIDPDICSDDEYFELLTGFGEVATTTRSTTEREAWVKRNTAWFAAKMKPTVEAELVDDESVFDLPEPSALVLANSTAVVALEDVEEDFGAVLQSLRSQSRALNHDLHSLYAARELSPQEVEAIATQNAITHAKNKARVNQAEAEKTNRLMEALLGNAA
jgi:hypothetical protein